MGIKGANLEGAAKLLNAMRDRQEQVRTLTNALNSGAWWRSPNGELSVEISDEERGQVEDFIRGYLDECDVIAAALRAQIGDRPKGGES